MSYDQWKTATPYDDEPDFIQEAEKWLTQNERYESVDPDGPEGHLFNAYWIMKGLLEYLE
jgi:hypothetical protein